MSDNPVERLDQLLELRAKVDVQIEQERARIHALQDAKRARGIIDAVAGWHDVEPVALVSKHRGQWVTAARHVAMWLLREAGLSYPDIGRALGRDHTSAIYGVRRVDTTPALRATALRIQADLARTIRDGTRDTGAA